VAIVQLTDQFDNLWTFIFELHCIETNKNWRDRKWAT